LRPTSAFSRRPAAIGGLRLLRAEDRDAKFVRIEDEEGVVVVHVTILLRRKVDAGADVKTALIGRVDFIAGFHLEREVLDPDVVVVVLAAVCLPEPEVLTANAKVDNLLGSPVARHSDVLHEAERPKNLEVERK
jgi:hypothetical protein